MDFDFLCNEMLSIHLKISWSNECFYARIEDMMIKHGKFENIRPFFTDKVERTHESSKTITEYISVFVIVLSYTGYSSIVDTILTD